jgi:hypothetical protein
MTQEDYLIGCTGCPPLFDEDDLLDDEEIERLRAALREVKSIADQAAIYAVGRRPQLDPGARFDLISETAREALSHETA